MILGITGSQITTIQQTTQPFINNAFTSVDGNNIILNWIVRNDDASSATIWSDADLTPPTTSRGTIISGANTSALTKSYFIFSGALIYAQAQASGKTISTIHSVFIES